MSKVTDLSGMLVIDLSEFPVIATERLLLREIVADDAQALFELRSDTTVMQHIGRTRATTLADAEALIDRVKKDRMNNDGITWAITLHGDPRLIGTIGFYRLQKEHFRGEIGYLMAPAHWGRGIMTEALQAAIAYGFNDLGFHSIEAITDPLNLRSMRSLERNGFVREGLFRENYHFDGKFYDSAVFSLLASDIG